MRLKSIHLHLFLPTFGLLALFASCCLLPCLLVHLLLLLFVSLLALCGIGLGVLFFFFFGGGIK